jgi:hypothetical protein
MTPLALVPKLRFDTSARIEICLLGGGSEEVT